MEDQNSQAPVTSPVSPPVSPSVPAGVTFGAPVGQDTPISQLNKPAPAQPPAGVSFGTPVQQDTPVSQLNKPPQPTQPIQDPNEGVLHKLFLGKDTAGGTQTPSGFWNLNPLQAFHVIPGSPMEKAIKFFKPDFQGAAVPGEGNTPQTVEKPLVDAAQFIDKDKHPMAKAVAEAAQSLTSPGNVATIIATGGMGMVDSPRALGMANRLLSAGFSVNALTTAYKQLKEFKKAYDAGDGPEAEYQLTHAVLSGTMAYLAEHHALNGEQIPLATAGDKAVLGAAGNATGEVGKSFSGVAGDIKNSKAVQGTAKALGIGQSLEDLVTKASPPSKGKAAGYAESVKGALPQLKEVFKKNPDVSTPMELNDNIQQHIDQNENVLQKKAKDLQGTEGKPAAASIINGAEDTLSKELDNYFRENEGAYKKPVVDAAKAEAIERLRQGEDTEPRDPSIFEAENLRRQLNKETAPAFGSDTAIPNAGRDAKIVAAGVLRKLIDQKYDELGVPGVKEWRQQEAPLIDVKDQLMNAYNKSKDMGDFNLVQAATKSLGWGAIGALLGHSLEGGLAGSALGIARDYVNDRLTNPNRLVQKAADLANKDTTPTGAAQPGKVALTPQQIVEGAGGGFKGIKNGVVEITLPRAMTENLPIDPRFKDYVSITLPEKGLTPESLKAAMDRKVAEMGGATETPKATPAAETTPKPETEVNPAASATTVAASGKSEKKEEPATEVAEEEAPKVSFRKSRKITEADIRGMLDKAARINRVDPSILHAQAHQESGLDQKAVSPKGARGVMQLMPKTAKELGVDSKDPQQNIDGGTKYLAQLHKRFGSYDKALAAYNWGPTEVQHVINMYEGEWLEHTPKETQDYVHKILRKAAK